MFIINICDIWNIVGMGAGGNFGSGYGAGYGGGAIKGAGYGQRAPGPYGGYSCNCILVHNCICFSPIL